jgi:hypothetical protein
VWCAFTSRLPPKKQAGDTCIGRSRGGLTTKLHLRVIGNALPVQIELSPGQMNDQPMAELLLIDLPAGADVIADKGYDADWIRDLIEDHHTSRRNQTATTASPTAKPNNRSAT